MIKNIIFDIGNVLLRFHPRQYFSQYFHDEKLANELCDVLLGSDLWNQYDLGILSLKQVEEKAALKLIDKKDYLKEMLQIWVTILEPMEESFQLMKKLNKEGYQIYLLSNLNEDAFMYIKRNSTLFSEVDGYVVSYQEKMAKPHKEIYKCICQRYHLLEEECVFIDDLKENVVAAINMGMHGIVFKEINQVVDELKQLLEKKLC